MTINRTQRVYALRRPLLWGVAITGLSLSPALVAAQDVGDVISGAINKQVVPANGNAAQSATQSASERGISRAVQGTLQGQSPGDAIRSGLGEAAQSSVETPQQTMQRDQNRQLQNQQAWQNQQPLPATPTGQPWQRDEQGRLYYQDASGQRVYSGRVYPSQSQHPTLPSDSLEEQIQQLRAQVEKLTSEVAALKSQVGQLKNTPGK